MKKAIKKIAVKAVKRSPQQVEAMMIEYRPSKTELNKAIKKSVVKNKKILKILADR